MFWLNDSRWDTVFLFRIIMVNYPKRSLTFCLLSVVNLPSMNNRTRMKHMCVPRKFRIKINSSLVSNNLWWLLRTQSIPWGRWKDGSVLRFVIGASDTIVCHFHLRNFSLDGWKALQLFTAVALQIRRFFTLCTSFSSLFPPMFIHAPDCCMYLTRWRCIVSKLVSKWRSIVSIEVTMEVCTCAVFSADLFRED